MKRVAITGMGAVTPNGLSLIEFWNSLLEGKSGVSKITQFDLVEGCASGGASQFRTRIAGEVQAFSPEGLLPKPERYDRATLFAIAAAKMALDDSGLSLDRVGRTRVGVYLGTGMGDMRTVEWGMDLLRAGRARRIIPTALPKVLPSSVPSNLAIFLGANGPSMGISSACASGTHAVGEACNAIRRGDADVMFAGGAEASITPLTVAGFSAMRVLSERNDKPEAASRPFDRDRDGFVIGEGAGILVLEDWEHAVGRGGRVYAEVVGYGTSCDAYHATGMNPSGDHCARAIQLALKGAGLSLQDVDYINAHGSSTQMNDITETRAIKLALGKRAQMVPISATKSMIGHLLCAAGAVELIATVLSLEHQVVPQTINLENQDPECDLDYVASASRSVPMRVAVKNSFGFGGHNAVLALRTPDDI